MLRFQVRWEALKHFEPGRDRVRFAFWHSDWPGEGGSQLLFKRRPGVMGCRAGRQGHLGQVYGEEVMDVQRTRSLIGRWRAGQVNGTKAVEGLSAMWEGSSG